MNGLGFGVAKGPIEGVHRVLHVVHIAFDRTHLVTPPADTSYSGPAASKE